jgi:soluble lytic murein transglycosylase-like protein
MKTILIGMILMAPFRIGADNKRPTPCQLNPIYCQIMKNNPKIDKKYAMKLSNVIHHVAILHGVNPKKYAAILAQESMYKLGAKNCTDGVCRDFGIAQINSNTAKAFKFDTKKLTTDLVYSIEAGAIVLADMKRMYGHKESNYWSRYNTSHKDKRKKYEQLVARYM